jgi:predicted GTPase
MSDTAPRRVLILGAAGRDFHVFNLMYRDDPRHEVVAFTMTQIPGVGERTFPSELAGDRYPDGIPIVPESEMDDLIRAHDIDEVVFAYSDVSHGHVMHLASRALAAGADFVLPGPEHTELSSTHPVIAVTAVRTGSGKSPISRWLSRHLCQRGLDVVVLRHPMPYGDLRFERVQRFASMDDLSEAGCTAEEREEYEPHIRFGNVVFAGVDYEAILAEADREADLIVWDGGNNDYPFLRPQLQITVVDALRPDQLTTHHPGEMVLRAADIVVINKVDSARADVVEAIARDVAALNPTATIVRAASPPRLEDPEAVAGRRVLVVEDGPTITHGGMSHGAGYVAAVAADAEVVDPRLTATGVFEEIYRTYPHIGGVLPAVGYNDDHLRALTETIEASDADLVVSGTPIDLGALISTSKPIVRVTYEFTEAGVPTLEHLVDEFVSEIFTEN